MPVDQLLKKNFWIVVLPLIAIAALLNAQAVTQLVGIGLGPDEKQLSASPAVARIAPTPTGSSRTLSADPILSRNPFDHVTGSLKPPPVDDSNASATVDSSDPWNAPMCDGVKVLVIAASADPDSGAAGATSAARPSTTSAGTACGSRAAARCARRSSSSSPT
jgi:general secretion pathway protein C